MTALNFCNDWFDYLGEDVDLASDQFVVALSNTAPGAEGSDPTADGNGVLANVTEVGYGDCSSRNITTTSSSQTGGTYKLVLQDLTLTSSGTVGPFRYVYIYDDTVGGDPLVGYYDRGSSITLNNGGTLEIDFDGTDGFFQIAEAP
jgi:hypothetical protein